MRARIASTIPADPLSREHVRHILAWYAQKHPDEDFAETFAVWLTPGLDWRAEYAGWAALREARVASTRDARDRRPRRTPLARRDGRRPAGGGDGLDASQSTTQRRGAPPIGDARQFDGDLRRIFAAARVGAGWRARAALSSRRIEGELVARIAYWAGVGPSARPSLLARARGARGGAGAARCRASRRRR